MDLLVGQTCRLGISVAPSRSDPWRHTLQSEMQIGPRGFRRSSPGIFINHLLTMDMEVNIVYVCP
jgi:hypothetical protein